MDTLDALRSYILFSHQELATRFDRASEMLHPRGEPRKAGEQCGPGNGRTTPGGGTKVSHKGWPRVTGVLWSVQEAGRGPHSHTGGPLNDELLGHHGSDTIDGAEGNDIIWGDWDPKNNNSSQRDKLDGGRLLTGSPSTVIPRRLC